MDYVFDHEKLRVYQEAISFITWYDEIGRSIDGNSPLKDQMNRASSSIALNIAEGNGRSLVRDRCRFFEIARGSAFECAACLDIFHAKRQIEEERLQVGKRHLKSIVSMLVRLMESISHRVAEAEAPYGSNGVEQEQEQEQE